MDSKELRIGNFVNYEGHNSIVNGVIDVPLFGRCVIIGDNEPGEKYVYPIPLTEEWLFRFGFKNKPNEMYINKSQYLLQVTGEYEEDGSINIDETWFDGIGDYSWIKEGGLKTMSVNVLCRGNYVCNCSKYVHQLQNLYFALTGQELTINE